MLLKQKEKTMKKLLLTALMLILPLVGCEKEEEEKCDCDQCPCEQIRDAEPEMEEGGEQSDMGLEGGSEEDLGGEEAGAEQEDLPVGGQDVSGGEEPELPVEGGQMEEEPVEEPVEECECSGSEGCAC